LLVHNHNKFIKIKTNSNSYKSLSRASIRDLTESNNNSEAGNFSPSRKGVKNISQGEQDEIFYKVLTKLSNYFDREDKNIPDTKKNLISQISKIVSSEGLNKPNDHDISKPNSMNEKHLREVMRDFSASQIKSTSKEESSNNIKRNSKNFKNLSKDYEIPYNSNQTVNDFKNIPGDNNIRRYTVSGVSDLEKSNKDSTDNIKVYKSTEQNNGFEKNKYSEIDINKSIKKFENRYNKFSDRNGSEELNLEQNIIHDIGRNFDFEFNPNQVVAGKLEKY